MGNSSTNSGNPEVNNELKKRLSALEYKVTQEKGTERAFSGKYWDNKKNGDYLCIVCNELLFKQFEIKLITVDLVLNSIQEQAGLHSMIVNLENAKKRLIQHLE